MSNKNLGPKTGTYEPPSVTQPEKVFKWDTIKKLHEEIGKSDKNYENLYALTAELIQAYKRKDFSCIENLIKEFNELQ